MTNIQVKNVDPELHEQLRQRATAANSTLSDYLLDLIRRDLRTPSRRAWLDQVGTLPRHNISSEAVVASIAEGRSEQPEQTTP